MIEGEETMIKFTNLIFNMDKLWGIWMHFAIAPYTKKKKKLMYYQEWIDPIVMDLDFLSSQMFGSTLL